MDLWHILNHLGEEREHYNGAVSPPVFQTSNFSFPTVEAFREALVSELDHHFYTRGNNPTAEILRKKLSALEGSEDALVFASGCAAISAAVFSQIKAGDHVISVQKPYGWAKKLFQNILAPFGVETTFVDGKKIENFEKAITPKTRLIYLESPNTFTFELQDLRKITALSKSRGIITILDNSYSTPLYQKAIEMGVDIVVHSGSKYLSGHSDVVAGVLCAGRKVIEKIFYGPFMNLGGILGPQESWLMLRGLRTLPLRMERITKTTAQIVAFLENHPQVEKMYYPFSPSFDQYELAKKQMKSASGLFSIQLKAASSLEVERFCNSLQRFLIACSWGGHESLCIPVCALSSRKEEPAPDLPWNLVRFSIGLESGEELIEDLEQAFALARTDG